MSVQKGPEGGGGIGERKTIVIEYVEEEDVPGPEPQPNQEEMEPDEPRLWSELEPEDNKKAYKDQYWYITKNFCCVVEGSQKDELVMWDIKDRKVVSKTVGAEKQECLLVDGWLLDVAHYKEWGPQEQEADYKGHSGVLKVMLNTKYSLVQKKSKS